MKLEAKAEDDTTVQDPKTTKAQTNAPPPNPLPQVQNKNNDAGSSFISGTDAVFVGK